MTATDFWSRRRAAVAQEARKDAAVEEGRVRQAAEVELAARTDEDILEELGLPEPEALETPDAVRDFLKSAVPQRLKSRALRRLWRLNPVLANLDGLVDYGEDYTDAATVVEQLQTAYQVGKGMLKHVEALAEAEEAPSAPSPEPELEEEQEDAAVVVAEAASDDAPQVTLAAPTFEPQPEDFEPAAPARRRMAFSFREAEIEGAA
ncbi:MAG: DUF3306 domain-containing protein [Pseudomonadota bacterium]